MRTLKTEVLQRNEISRYIKYAFTLYFIVQLHDLHFSIFFCILTKNLVGHYENNITLVYSFHLYIYLFNMQLMVRIYWKTVWHFRYFIPALHILDSERKFQDCISFTMMWVCVHDFEQNMNTDIQVQRDFLLHIGCRLYFLKVIFWTSHP